MTADGCHINAPPESAAGDEQEKRRRGQAGFIGSEAGRVDALYLRKLVWFHEVVYGCMMLRGLKSTKYPLHALVQVQRVDCMEHFISRQSKRQRSTWPNCFTCRCGKGSRESSRDPSSIFTCQQRYGRRPLEHYPVHFHLEEPPGPDRAAAERGGPAPQSSLSRGEDWISLNSWFVWITSTLAKQTWPLAHACWEQSNKAERQYLESFCCGKT